MLQQQDGILCLEATMCEEFIECPICNDKVKNLIRHLRGKHDRSLKDRAAIESKFPELKGKKMQITVFDKSKEYKCEFCNKVYHRTNDIQNHLRLYHPEHYKKHIIEKKCPTITCPICGKESGNLKQHVGDTHDMTWDTFCAEYNWDPKLVKVITDDYRKHLSDNKKEYYNSDKGMLRRESQSIEWRNNNPSKDRATMCKSIHTRAMNERLPVEIHSCYGIKVNCYGRTFRSFCEFEFYVICNKLNMKVEYEPGSYCIKWFNEEKNFYTTYLPDFYVEGIGLIELKGNNRDVRIAKETPKYINVSEVYSGLGVPYKITTNDMFFKEFGISMNYKIGITIKQEVLNLAKDGKIRFTAPSKRSRILKNIFDVDDLSKVSCVTITNMSRWDKNNELQKD